MGSLQTLRSIYFDRKYKIAQEISSKTMRDCKLDKKNEVRKRADNISE